MSLSQGFSRPGQVLETHPHLFDHPLKFMEEHIEFLLTTVGVSKAKLGKVQYCLLYPFAFI
jgi:hypothetical protein